MSVEERVRGEVDDPALAGWIAQLPEVTRSLVLGPAPAKGERHEAMMEVAYRAGEHGLSNDAVLEVLDAVCLWWDYHPGTYDRWTHLLGILRRVRIEFPNSSAGEGYRPEVSAS